MPLPAPDPLAALRLAYAEELATEANVRDPTLVDAFAAVPRERFLGPGPWWIAGEHRAGLTPDADPAHLYANVLVAIDRARGINNGEPLLHMMSLAELAPRRGDRAAHIGCGTGYYTAILATLVGRTGRVDAYEAEKDLAARTRDGLARWPWVATHGAADSETFRGPFDAIYVSAAATAPRAEWLDALADGGRLVFPLADISGRGVMLRLERQGEDFAARVFSRAAFIPMQGGIGAAEGEAVARAVRSGAIFRARALRRGPSPAGERALVAWPVGRLIEEANSTGPHNLNA